MLDLNPPSIEEQVGARRTRQWASLIVVAISLAMIALPVVKMGYRLAGTEAAGAAVWVRHLTMWLGFVGALLATGAGKHLGLATAHFMRPGRARNLALAFNQTVSAIVCLFFAYASAKVVLANRIGVATLAGGIPEWWSETVLPGTVIFMMAMFVWRMPFGWRGRATSTAALVVFGALFFLGGDAVRGFLVWPCVLLVILAFVLGAPVFVTMAGIAMLFFVRGGTPVAAVPTETLRLVENDSLPAIPLLTLAGYVLAAGKASERLVRAYKSIFGWLPGGLSLMAISVCALFTTFTGGSGVTILALGGLLLPALVKDNYPEDFSLGLVTASGSLGLLFPPSLPVILYGAVASQPGSINPVSAEQLYIGGLVPGILMILLVAAWSIRAGIVAKAPRQPFQAREVFHALWSAKWDLGLPTLVLVVIVTGYATVVEAAALGAAYALVVELFVYRDVHPWREMPSVIAKSALLVGSVLIVMGVALGLTNYLVDAQIPDALLDWVQAHFHSQWSFLLALNGLLLVLGSVFEIYAAIIVLAPLIAPLGSVFNVDPVHLGVVFLANLELGFLFPPMGLNLFLAASRFNQPLPRLYRTALPFLVIMSIGVLVITYVPAMTTGMVKLLGRHY